MKANLLFLLLICGLSSTTLGDGGNSTPGELDSQGEVDNEGNCPLQLEPNLKIPGVKCSAPSYDCSRITCTARFSDKDLKLSMNINQWAENLSAYITFSVPDLGFSWSHLFKDGDKIEISGFPLNIEGFAVGADVFLQLSLKKSNGTIDFKVDLEAAWTEPTQKTYTVTVIEGKVPVAQEPEIAICYGPIYRGFKTLPTIAKVMIGVFSVAFIVLLVVAVSFCYHKKRATTAGQLKVKPPSYDEATSTRSKVPMQPLINEV